MTGRFTCNPTIDNGSDAWGSPKKNSSLILREAHKRFIHAHSVRSHTNSCWLKQKKLKKIQRQNNPCRGSGQPSTYHSADAVLARQQIRGRVRACLTAQILARRADRPSRPLNGAAATLHRAARMRHSGSSRGRSKAS